MMTNDSTFVGFHKRVAADGTPNGSFEVFYAEAGALGEVYSGDQPTKNHAAGFFWWPRILGEEPDHLAAGPFPTAEGAYLDAIGD